MFFGQNGHRIVARLAENHLTEKARDALMEITNGRQLAQLANWADEIKSDPNWDHAKPWHYISIDDDESWDNFERSPDGDILEALARFEKRLKDPNISREEKWQALAFYIHFVGDIHQPLHVGRRDDLGGNTIDIFWFGEKMNLHRVWDTELIENQRLSFTEYATFLDHFSSEEIKEWQAASYLDWAKDSRALRNQVYDFAESGKLYYKYASQNTPALNRQIAKAGIRLAG